MIVDSVYTYHWESYRKPVRLDTPVTMSEWDHRFPRFCVRYTGYSFGRSMDLRTDYVAEPVVAVRMGEILATENPSWWVRIEDQGSAPHPHLREGTEFTSESGRRHGVITIRNRYEAAVHWHDDPAGPVLYPLDCMRVEATADDTSA
ncbi:hypothetical protein ACFWB2_43295 [Streptomyces virginiae]|uniref:hypothetical protein n=1 Tax=Streptomyces virginiae TaxID=1961 RepID=UPI0036D1C900